MQKDMRKVLILMSERTGTGHKSSANAIENKLLTMNYQVKQLDCFKTMGKAGEKMENSYIPLTTKHPFIWKMSHGFSQFFTAFVHQFVYNNCKKKMLKEILDFQPDLIISDQCMFTKAISKLLKKNNLDIPFMIAVIDLVNPPHVWRDKKANVLFLPTEKVYEQYLHLGFKPEQLVVSGFPIREDIPLRTEPKKASTPTKILMVNPSINLKKNVKFVCEAARLNNVEINFVCGRDARLFNKLTKLKNSNKLLQNVNIYGFISNMNEMLASTHILLTKAGPNMLLEGTRSGTAVVVTGHIPGQEAHNHQYIVDNHYGERCENPNKIYNLLNSMIEPNNLQRYLNNVVTTKYNNGAEVIAKTIDEYLNNKLQSK